MSPVGRRLAGKLMRVGELFIYPYFIKAGRNIFLSSSASLRASYQLMFI